ncbi:hypothetical protein [Campylobacter vulpis]|nr:hypothetical protein [Campylobacter vulpis]
MSFYKITNLKSGLYKYINVELLSRMDRLKIVLFYRASKNFKIGGF